MSEANGTANGTLTYQGKEYHQLFPELFRKLYDSEESDLRASIKTRGVLEPILTDDENGVIDGWNRLRIGIEEGQEVPMIPFEGMSDDGKRDIAKMANYARRQLSRKEIEAAKKERIQKVKRQKKAGKSVRQIAKSCNVSSTQVRRDLGLKGAPYGAPGTSENEAKNDPEKEPENTPESEQEAVPEVPTDPAGIEIPERCLAIFADAKKFDEANRLMNELRRLVIETIKGPAGHYIKGRVAHFETAIDNLKSQFSIGKPSHICPYCEAKKKACTCCAGEGWVPKHLFDRSPKGKDARNYSEAKK